MPLPAVSIPVAAFATVYDAAWVSGVFTTEVCGVGASVVVDVTVLSMNPAPKSPTSTVPFESISACVTAHEPV